MKKTSSKALVALLLLTLSLPGFVLAQQPAAPEANPNNPTQTPRDTRGRRTQESAISPSGVILGSRDASRMDATAGVENGFAEALSIVQENYVDRFGDNKLEYNNVFKSSIIGMLRSLDPHSNYFDREEFEELRTDQRSEYFGIGASINNWRVGDQLDTYIMATFDGSPAARAGLRYGDRIIAVDNQPMRGKPSSDVRDKIRGPRGSVVKVTVERASNNQPETVEITRDAVGQPSVPDAYMIRPGVGYIDMSRGFNTTTSGELERALESLRAQGMTQLVLDLRGNPGGFLDQAVRVADKFLQRGQLILVQRGRGRGSEIPYSAKNSSPDQTPLVVLINRGSASASEIVAGALQDHDRAFIVGETSFGKGLVQTIMPLDYGAGLTLTSAKYYTPSGRLIQRDYSAQSIYDYYTNGRRRAEALGEKNTTPARPVGAESRTDSGRLVYSGGGITPDEAVAPRELQPGEIRLLDPIFGFTRDLVNKRIAGFDAYKVQRAIDFKHELQANDYPMTDALFAAFKRYVAANPSYKVTDALITRHADYARRQLRYNIVTAAYGTTMATRVLNGDDPQTLKGVEALPRARDLALAASRGRNPQQKSFEE